MALSAQELALYPEAHFLDEEEISEKLVHSILINYLVDVLKWLFFAQNWFVVNNLALTHPSIHNNPHSITPDVMLFTNQVLTKLEIDQLSTWNVPQKGAPSVAFEIASPSTWETDIQGGPHQKPAAYGRIGVQEYWAYDPNTPQIWHGVNRQRLLGWRYNAAGQPESIQSDERGWFWSELLQSWLVADGDHLRLYDRAGQMRLRESEAERQARLQAQAAEQQAQQARLQAEAAKQAAEQQAEAELQARLQIQQQAEAAQERLATLEAELRRLKGEI